MPKFTPNAIIKDCWSSIGNITFYHRNGQCYWKRKARPVFPGTPAQLDQAEVHHRAILAWQRQLHEVQLQWNKYAKSVPSHRPPYDNNHHISGFNLFVSAYHGFAQLGNEHVPVPQPFPEFPSAALEVLEIIPGAETTTIRCRLTLTDTVHPERWHLSSRIKLTVSGLNSNPGCMRSYLAIPDGNIVINRNTSARNITFTIASSLADGLIQAHIKYRMIDEITGYRNNWKLLLSHQNKDRLLI
jgi:hypothetical protein